MDILPGFPEHAEHAYTVTLSGVQFRFRFVFRPRLQAWYLDLFAANGTPLVRARRVSAGWSPLYGIPVVDGPTGMLWVRGPDAYQQGDFGDTVRVVFYPTSELTPAADDGDPIVELT